MYTNPYSHLEVNVPARSSQIRMDLNQPRPRARVSSLTVYKFEKSASALHLPQFIPSTIHVDSMKRTPARPPPSPASTPSALLQ